jgi:putative transposase
LPQPRRIQGITGPFHVTARGNRGQAIFVDDRDRTRFLEMLSRIALESKWTIDAYCLMTNHYHLVLEADTRAVSSGMQRLNAGYAQWFNRWHGMSGHLFRHRFYAGVISGELHFLELVRYIALNPVRGGLCATPESWTWSSYHQLVTGARKSFLSTRALAYFGSEASRAREALREFVEGGLLAA